MKLTKLLDLQIDLVKKQTFLDLAPDEARDYHTRRDLKAAPSGFAGHGAVSN
jgi:hypothetical protein